MSGQSTSNVLSGSASTSVEERMLANTELATSAFEAYYAMGSERTLIILESQTRIPFEVLKQWSEVYAWDERIRERSKELDRAFEQYYKDKTKDIRNRLIGQMEGLLGEMEASSLGLPFHVKDVNDFRALAQAYESLVRANTLATKQIESLKEDAPVSWSDLLGSIEDQSLKRQE